ncbi:hypothetical protein GIB67_028200 [Kingdonia uniflora]|uniref:Ubiquitin-like domain-containing protein n=1 Tax=Kingdonia uniflora TaxID=39325 RepID=A0A7J7KZ52_9MAGN|nr:hypothetical protein GIB67_028200 [Kingdonia uniflora]
METSTKSEEVVVGYNSNTVKKARLQSTLAALLEDPVLTDVPKKPTLADVDTLISLELGSAMRITVAKMDDTFFEVAVLNSATVKDLKLAIKKKTNELEQSKMGHRHISWRHVWSNFCLSHHNNKLIDDSAMLQDFGIRTNSQVHETPRDLDKFFSILEGLKPMLRLIRPAWRLETVHFVPYVMSREFRKHSRRKKHRFFHGLSKRSMND